MGFFGFIPQQVVKPYRGPKDTLDKMVEHCLGNYGERSIIVRRFTETIVSQIQPKDYLSQILAIRNCTVQPSPTKSWMPMLVYTNDPRHVELVRTPERMVKEIMSQGYTVVDCDEYTELVATMCLQIGREVELVAVGFAPGNLSHVLARVREPKTRQWILMDGVAGPREKEAAKSAKEIFIRSLD
jgi:hypothetical protein